MPATKERERLVTLLEQLSTPAYWECLQERWGAHDKHREWHIDFAAAARRHQERGEQQEAESCRRLADEEKLATERHHQLSLDATSAFGEARWLIRSLMPQLLGGFPLDDLRVLRSKSPEQLAEKCSGVLGQLLATEPRAQATTKRRAKKIRTSPTAERNKKWAEAFDADPLQYPTVTAFAKAHEQERATMSKALKNGGSTRLASVTTPCR